MKNQPDLNIQQLKLYRSGFEGTATLGFYQQKDAEHTVPEQEVFSVEEICHCRTMTVEKQASFINGRYVAKHCLQHIFPTQNLPDILIDNGIFGQPMIVNDAELNLSISHTGESSCCIIFPRAHPMGIDIQQINEENNQAIQSQLTPTESSLLQVENLNSHLWSGKEALSKILQTGLMVPLSILEVDKIISCENYFISYFKNFPQYKSFSFYWKQNICAIALPANTHIDMQILLT